MKKAYVKPEARTIIFDSNSMVLTSGESCTCDAVCTVDGATDCPPDDACRFCYYLVCTPTDVIIG